MSFTRYHDDPSRIQKSLDESTFTGRYQINTPGPGTQMPFMNDPQVRMQTWGANRMTDTTNLESELRGLGRVLDHNYDRTYQEVKLFQGAPVAYPVSNVHVEESRASHPAWMYKDQDHTRWEAPFLNPLANVEKRFQDNIQTRLLR